MWAEEGLQSHPHQLGKNPPEKKRPLRSGSQQRGLRVLTVHSPAAPLMMGLAWSQACAHGFCDSNAPFLQVPFTSQDPTN